MPRLTMSFVDKQIPQPDKGKILYYRDDLVTGFGLRVRHDSMSYFAECRVNGVNRRVTIGKHGKWTPEAARKEAKKLLGQMAAGIDPRKESHRGASLTLAEAYEEYLESKEFRLNSRMSFNRVMAQSLGDWQRKPVTSITRQMVEERFRELSQGSKTGTSGKANANLSMQVLRAVLNYASLKYEVDGEPLIAVNPVSRLTQIRSWHKLPTRQGVIPYGKLSAFYAAVMSLERQTAKYYYLILRLTGLRKNEAAKLLWTDVDLDDMTIKIRAENSKGVSEHRLPLSDWLMEILRRRFAERKESPYVFPGLGGLGRYYGAYQTLEKIREQTGCYFILHDLGRVFLTTAEKLDIPHYALKKLAGHAMREDITDGHLVIDVERLREPIQRITDRLVELMGCGSRSQSSEGGVIKSAGSQ